MVEWGAPESDGGAPLEGYKIAVRDARRQMWMEVGRVNAGVQRLRVQDLAEGHEYHIRIFAKNEVGFSEPLENDEPFKVVRPAGIITICTSLTALIYPSLKLKCPRLCIVLYPVSSLC
jgi:hypothetical protein